jgi:3-methyladenine DNA glycosylase AlkD
MSEIQSVRADLEKVSSPERAKINAWFFKTKPGEYGHGDQFMGVTVPAIRKIVRTYRDDMMLKEIEQLVKSPIHEERLCGLLFLVEKYKKADGKGKTRIYNLYIKLAKTHINNWDLVDLSSRDIIGEYSRMQENSSQFLQTLAHSKNIWERRIAIVSTYAFIRTNEVGPTLMIAELLLRDTHDLIHKATGWMLREAWKREPEKVEAFLIHFKSAIPRTTLRYAIERMPAMQRKEFMAK